MPELQTDTHLSRDFNKVLQTVMFQCNQMGLQVEAEPHFMTLMSYKASVSNLFLNTFFLFTTIPFKSENGNPVNLSEELVYRMSNVDRLILNIKYDPVNQTQKHFDEVLGQCKFVRMMIMYGLNTRNMLVRQSEKEKFGAEIIDIWEKKSMFSKGKLSYSTTKDIGGLLNAKANIENT